MWPVRVVVLEVLTENSNQMCLVQDHDVIKSLAASRADRALGVSVLPRGARCRRAFLGSQIGNARANDIAVDNRSLRNAIDQYLEHDHLERPHQGLGNRYLQNTGEPTEATAPVECRK